LKEVLFDMGNQNSGRAKKPAALKRLEGNRGKRPIQKEPVPDGAPVCPGYMTEEQRACWRSTVRYLPKGLLTGADTAFLEIYAIAWADFREAQRALARTGKLVKGADGQPVRNPWKALARQAAAEINTFGASLGMSPLSRTRLIAADNGEEDPMQVLLGMDERFADVPTQ
jgi:P27 family predicted phage terminase small subunit